MPEIVPELMAMPAVIRNNVYIDRQLASDVQVFDEAEVVLLYLLNASSGRARTCRDAAATPTNNDAK
jgi:hypothetical protein